MRKGGIKASLQLKLNWFKCLWLGHEFQTKKEYEDYSTCHSGYHASLGSNEPVYRWTKDVCIHCGKTKHTQHEQVGGHGYGRN